MMPFFIDISYPKQKVHFAVVCCSEGTDFCCVIYNTVYSTVYLSTTTHHSINGFLNKNGHFTYENDTELEEAAKYQYDWGYLDTLMFLKGTVPRKSVRVFYL
jgi:hypothetical protein